MNNQITEDIIKANGKTYNKLKDITTVAATVIGDEALISKMVEELRQITMKRCESYYYKLLILFDVIMNIPNYPLPMKFKILSINLDPFQDIRKFEEDEDYLELVLHYISRFGHHIKRVKSPPKELQIAAIINSPEVIPDIPGRVSKEVIEYFAKTYPFLLEHFPEIPERIQIDLLKGPNGVSYFKLFKNPTRGSCEELIRQNPEHYPEIPDKFRDTGMNLLFIAATYAKAEKHPLEFVKIRCEMEGIKISKKTLKTLKELRE